MLCIIIIILLETSCIIKWALVTSASKEYVGRVLGIYAIYNTV